VGIDAFRDRTAIVGKVYASARDTVTWRSFESYEERGVLHFVSRGYYIDPGLGMKLWLPEFLTPGVTHVEHIDLGHGWFRFTMAVTHPWFGEVYFQTGRFCATEVLE